MRTIGTISEINACKKMFPKAKLEDISAILNSRHFTRWYKKNHQIINTIAFTIPAFTMTLFGITPGSPLFSLLNPAVTAEAGTGSFFQGQGAVLLHMLVVGFITLVLSSFLKFTGRGDFIPLVAFVAGGVILIEVINLFNSIYGAVRTLLSM